MAKRLTSLISPSIARRALRWALRVVAIGVVPINRSPGSAVAWLLAIFTFPKLGLGAFAVIGSPFLRGPRKDGHARDRETAAALFSSVGARPLELTPDSTAVEAAAVLNQRLTAFPPLPGGLTALHGDSRESVEAMSEAVDAAERSVHVAIYIMSLDPFTQPFVDALGRAARRGVDVRVMFDDLGSRKYPGVKPLQQALDAAGVHWTLAMPLRPHRGGIQRIDLRNHRKMMIVDGRVAFMGSMNMIDPHYENTGNERSGRQWVDIMGRYEGPTAAAIDAVFSADWRAETGEDLLIADTLEGELDRLRAALAEPHDPGSMTQIVPSGPAYTTFPNLRMFTSLAHGARRSIRVVSPYFVPEESLRGALTGAAISGVDVEVYVSEEADQVMVDNAQSSYYQELLEAGVRIVQYPKPAVLHTKCMIVDEEVAVFGSSNMDIRSFVLDFEISALTTDPASVRLIAAVVDDYRARSRVLDPRAFRRRPLHRRWTESLARLTSALQ